MGLPLLSFEVYVGLGHDKELLEREIGVIQELLEEQPDSKCMDRVPSLSRPFADGFHFQGAWNHWYTTSV